MSEQLTGYPTKNLQVCLQNLVTLWRFHAGTLQLALIIERMNISKVPKITIYYSRRHLYFCTGESSCITKVHFKISNLFFAPTSLGEWVVTPKTVDGFLESPTLTATIEWESHDNKSGITTVLSH